MNIKGAIEKYVKNTCKYCKEAGASIGCSIKNCKTYYHFLCAVKYGCVVDNIKYISFCRSHRRGKVSRVDKNNYKCHFCHSKLDEDLMQRCKKCEQYYHVYCCFPILEKLEGNWLCKDCE
jgi:hypothetical protein